MGYKRIGFKVGNISIQRKNKMLSKYNNISSISNVTIFLSIFTLLIIFLLGLILPKNIQAYSAEKYKNDFYIKAINNTFSIFKAAEVKDVSVQQEYDMKYAVLSFLGIDILNPISIISKEVPYLNMNIENTNINVDNSNNEKKAKEFILNPFKLEDKEISKVDSKGEQTNEVVNINDPKLKKLLDKSKPEVLIYHSHTCESYRLGNDDTSKTNSTLDQSKNVCAVGDVLAEALEKNYGIAVIHDKTVHDKGDYNSAYKKAGVTFDKYLKEYGDFKLIIDLHRDEVKDKSSVTTKINGENVAKFMFVVTEKNPRYKKQKKLIDSIIEISNKLYPDLLRGKSIYAYQWGMDYYSQDKSDNAVLIEVGAESNTIQEAKNTGKYLSRIIAEYINGKNE